MAYQASVATLLMTLLVCQRGGRVETAECRYLDSPSYSFQLTIALLATSQTDFKLQKVFQENILITGELKDCFGSVQWLYLYINETLHLEKDGWTQVEAGINSVVTNAAVPGNTMPMLVMGPYYSNLAMVLDRLQIAYVVTESKGYGWIDQSRVTDRVTWRTVVDILPPAREQNEAVADLFRNRDWGSAILVMPSDAGDNQECQDLVRQLLDAAVSLIPFTLDPLSPSVDVVIKDIIRRAHISRQNQIVVCSPRDARDQLVEKTLIQARDLAVLDDKDVTFLFVDPASSLKPFSSASNMHKLGLLSAKCQVLAFRFTSPRDAENRQEGQAISADAGRVVTLGLNDFLLSLNGERFMGFQNDRFIAALRNVNVQGHTGRISFDDQGQRSNYTLGLYNHCGKDLYRRIATWSPDSRNTTDRLNITGMESEEEQARRSMALFPKLVKIVVVLEFPFVMKRQYVNGKGHSQYDGFTIDLIEELAKELNFKYEVYLSPGNSYGGPNGDGTWDGMVGEIMNGNATLACGAISITSAREAVIDFSLGVLSTGVNILIHKPDESYNMFQFMKPFSLQLWVAILGALTLVSSVYYILDYCNGEERKFTFKETIWFTIGTMLKRGSDFVPTPVSQRILTIGFSFFVIITVSSYTANMAAFLTTKKFARTVDSFESLAAHHDMKVFSVKHSATSGFFQKGTKSAYKMIWSRMRKGGLLSDAAEGLTKVVNDKHAAFVFDYLINEGAQNRNCTTMAIGSPILLQEHGIGMKPGAEFKTRINIAILKLKESGFLAKLKKKWWDDKRECQLGKGKLKADQAQFGIKHTLGVFIVSLVGVGVSAILFSFKKISFAITTRFKRYRARRAEKKSANNATIIGNDAGTPI